MDLLLINAFWMTINILLAFSAVFFGFLAQKQKKAAFKYLLLFLWLVFVPNTFYIFTDIIHIPKQWAQLGSIEQPILILEYLILEISGFLAFILAMYFFEKALKTLRVKQKFIRGKIVFVNFLIGFGIILGRFERINSWEPVTDPSKVVNGILNTVSSLELLILALFLGLAGNLLYFLYKKKVITFAAKYFRIRNVDL